MKPLILHVVLIAHKNFQLNLFSHWWRSVWTWCCCIYFVNLMLRQRKRYEENGKILRNGTNFKKDRIINSTIARLKKQKEFWQFYKCFSHWRAFQTFALKNTSVWETLYFNVSKRLSPMLQHWILSPWELWKRN